jgi:hypothetical protein
VDEPSRAWTRAEADAALPWVGEVVRRAQRLWDDYRRQAVHAARVVRQDGHGVVPADPTPIRDCIDELAEQAVVLRDIGRGLIDFPARTADGRWYWLCWLLGEDAVDWWHWPDDGFAGRRRLVDEPPE